MARNDPATSTFNTVGDYGSVQNASGTGITNMEMAPRGRSGGADTPGTGTKANRSPSLINAVTGQRLADEMNANLDDAARHPATDPYELTAGQVQERYDPTPAESRWSNVNLKLGAMADALQGASDAQYAQLPARLAYARSFEDGQQVGHHVAASMQNDHYLGRLFGNPGMEDCCG